MLVVCTDHGFLLGEHDSWAKCWCPFYNEIARTPFYVWDPRSARAGDVSPSLVQPAIDLAPTLLTFFGLSIPEDMLGKDLTPAISSDQPLREAGIFGLFGGHVNVTDGRYVYMRGPVSSENSPLYEHTLMPVRMRQAYSTACFQNPAQTQSFPFMKGCHALKLPTMWQMPGNEAVCPDLSTRLFDLQADPGQLSSVEDPETENRMIELLRTLMTAAQAPEEQFRRLGL